MEAEIDIFAGLEDAMQAPEPEVVYVNEAYAERPAPCSIEAEQAVLGSLLLEPALLTDVSESISSVDFYRKAHRMVYAAIIELQGAGATIDSLTVAQALKDKGVLDDIGGRQYLIDLALGVSTPANAAYYARIVSDKAILRNLIHAGNEIISRAYEDTEAAPVVGRAEELIRKAVGKQIRAALDFTPKPISELMNKEFEDIRWAIEDLLPEGLTILAGDPKVGKSWLALDICLAVASGTKIMGDYETSRGEVLYLALEDSERRLCDRITLVAQEDGANENAPLYYEINIPNMAFGGLEDLDDWLTAHPNCRLVVIDTLARFMPTGEKGVNAYQSDTVTVAPLQRLALKHRIAMIAVHHVRKQKSDDIFGQISGSHGITGVADASWVLQRARTESTGRLTVTGRDIKEMQLVAEFNEDTHRWTLIGDVRQEARRKTLIALQAAFGNTAFTFDMARGPLGVALTQAKNVVSSLTSEGYIEKLAERCGKAFQFRLTDKYASRVVEAAS
ncbi:MAG: AAA family ATPase [Patescibacteria group bacterium]|nr:AAA family ATPase [Patescibacteria group bacterium]